MNPSVPVKQKSQPSLQPTWVEMQTVLRSLSGMKTDSMTFPSESLKVNFVVPSSPLVVRRTSSRPIV